MTSLEWGRLHHVDNQQIDTDHHVIANLIVQLGDAVETDQGREIVSNIINAIAEFSQHHIKREIAFWADTQARPVLQHTQQHNMIINAMKAMDANLRAGIWPAIHEIQQIKPLWDMQSLDLFSHSYDQFSTSQSGGSANGN